MKTYAQVQGGVVVNTVEVDDPANLDPNSTWVDVAALGLTAPDIGYTWDGTTFAPASGLPPTAYGQAVTMTTDGVHDSYYAGTDPALTVAHGAPLSAVYLQLAKQENMQMARVALQAFVDSRYSLDTRFNFMALYTLANLSGLSARATYVAQLFTWAQACVYSAVAYSATVSACTTPAQVVALAPSFTALVASDPLVNPMTAIQINS